MVAQVTLTKTHAAGGNTRSSTPLHSTALDRVAWINFHVSRAGCSFTFPRRLPGLWACIQGPRTRSVAAPGYKIRQNMQTPRSAMSTTEQLHRAFIELRERQRERELTRANSVDYTFLHLRCMWFIGLLAAQQVVHLTCAANQSINQSIHRLVGIEAKTLSAVCFTSPIHK